MNKTISYLANLDRLRQRETPAGQALLTRRLVAWYLKLIAQQIP